MTERRFVGTGRRKASVARVVMVPGKGTITVNGRDVREFFPYETNIMDLMQPLVATNNESGKVIDNFYCYIATITSSEEAKQAEVGDRVKVRLSNNAEADAEITNIIKEDDGDIILILKLTEQIEELINYRKITFDLIWWDASGLKVPNQAIVSENDLNYVVRNRAGYLSKILVKVERQGDKYSIIDSYTTILFYCGQA